MQARQHGSARASMMPGKAARVHSMGKAPDMPSSTLSCEGFQLAPQQSRTFWQLIDDGRAITEMVFS